MIKEAVRDAMPENIKQASPQPFIKGTRELAEFLRVSVPRAQQLKNSGIIPFWQDGRTVLFDPDKVRDAFNSYTQKSRRT